MSTITFKISRFVKFFIFSIILFQQAHAQKAIIQEWDFDTNSQSNNGLEFSWPNASSAKPVADGTHFISAINNGGSLSKKGSVIPLGSISTGQLTYSITLKSWRLSNAGGAFWDLVFSDADGEVSKHKIIIQSKTTDVNKVPDGQGGFVNEPYYATAVYTQYQGDNAVWSENF